MKVIKISGVLLSLWLVAASSAAQSLLPDYWNDSSHEVAQPVDNADMTEDNYVFQGQSLNSDQSDDEIEIYSSDGYIYIRSSKKQSAKVFTILGQLVFNGNVGPGLTEIQMQPRGIYIVKVGSVTQKLLNLSRFVFLKHLIEPYRKTILQEFFLFAFDASLPQME